MSSYSKLFRCRVRIFPCWLHRSQLQGSLLIARVCRRELCVGISLFFLLEIYFSSWKVSRMTGGFNIRPTLTLFPPKKPPHTPFTTLNVCVMRHGDMTSDLFLILWLVHARLFYLQWKTASHVPHWSLSLLTAPEATKSTRRTGLTQTHTDTDRLSDKAPQLRFVLHKTAVDVLSFCFPFPLRTIYTLWVFITSCTNCFSSSWQKPCTWSLASER